TQLPLSRALTRVKIDVPLHLKPEDLQQRAPDADKLRAFYERYEFKAALRELEDAPRENAAAETAPPAASPPAPARPVLEKHYELVLTQDRLAAWLARLRTADLIAFDTETTSLDPMRAE